jgi:hypothetical protein
MRPAKWQALPFAACAAKGFKVKSLRFKVNAGCRESEAGIQNPEARIQLYFAEAS